MKVLFVRAIIENRVNLQGIAEQMGVGGGVAGSTQQEHHKDRNVIVKNVAKGILCKLWPQMIPRIVKVKCSTEGFWF